MIHLPFNCPYLTGKEIDYISEAISQGHISGDGLFTKKCHQFFQEKWGFKKVFLTTSCTDALEMSALLLNISAGDEVIVPSFTFPSTANAFMLRGAHIVFADSCGDNPNLDVSQMASLITKKTKAIVPVHYAGVACDMDPIMALANEHRLHVVEDAAHSIDSYYKGIPLGKIGHFGAFSFHESKNISSGEGGLLAVNDSDFILRAEIIREKGTNRTQFFRNEIVKYTWVDIGSSFLPSEMTAAFLYAQLEHLEPIQKKRLVIWNRYFEGLKPLADRECFQLPSIPSYATQNAHLFYIVCRGEKERQLLIDFLKLNGISAVFHYQPLHRSPFYEDKHGERNLPNCKRYGCSLLRLPLYSGLSLANVDYVIGTIIDFFKNPQ